MKYKGSGGGGPSDKSDTLFSTDAFEILLGIAEGPIFGIAGDTPEEKLQNIFINDTPIFDTNNVDNFDESQLLIRFEKGLEVTAAEDPEFGQTPIRYIFDGATVNQSVGSQLLFEVPISKTTPLITGGFDRIQVRILVSSLVRYTDDGARTHEVDFDIKCTKVGATTWTLESHNISGKTTGSGFTREYTIIVPRTVGTEAYEIEVVKRTNDEDDDKRDSQIYWQSYDLISSKGDAYSNDETPYSDPSLEYHPGTSMLHFSGVLGQQLNSVPTINANYRGLMCSVPSNYTPETKTYDETSAWDGTFSAEKYPTDNPVWLAHELITNLRFGAVRYNPKIKVNRYSWYEKAKYADGYNAITGVKDLNDPISGAQQVARYTFNAVLTDPSNGIKFVNQILATAYFLAVEDELGEIKLYADMPSLPVETLTPEMCVQVTGQSEFLYSYSPLKERSNEVKASYIDKDNEYVTQYLGAIRDEDAIAKYGLNSTEFTALGTTTSWECYRKMYLMLSSMLSEVEIVTFTLPLAGIQFSIFEVVNIIDPVMGYGLSGRIISLNYASRKISVRDPLFIDETGIYTVKIQGLTQTHEYTTFISLDKEGIPLFEFTLNADLPPQVELAEYPVVRIENPINSTKTVGLPKPYRITNIEESDDKGIDMYVISAVEVNPNKHTDADLLTQSVTPQYNFFRSKPLKKVQNLQVVDQSTVRTLKGANNSLWISWDEQEDRPLGTLYNIEVITDSISGANQTYITSENFAEIKGLDFGNIIIQVTAEANSVSGPSAFVKWEIVRVNAGDLTLSSAVPVINAALNGFVLNADLELPYAFSNNPNEVIDLLKVGYIDRVFCQLFDISGTGNVYLGEFFSKNGEFNLTASQIRQVLKNPEVLPDELQLRFHFEDSVRDRYPGTSNLDFTYVIQTVGTITGVVLSALDSDYSEYQADWDSTHFGYDVTLFENDGKTVVFKTTVFTNSLNLPTLDPSKNYKFVIQGFSEAYVYSVAQTTQLNAPTEVTPLASPDIKVLAGSIVLTPPSIVKSNRVYQFKYNTVNNINTALDGVSGNALTINNVIGGQTYYFWYRSSSEAGVGSWRTTSAVGQEQTLYDWKVWANDAAGAGISVVEGDRPYVGISSGHTTSTPVITDPSIYTFILKKGEKGDEGILPAPTGNPGLFANDTHLGYHDGTNWATYFDSAGRLYLNGSSDLTSFFYFDGGDMRLTGFGDFDGGLRADLDGAYIGVGREPAADYSGGFATSATFAEAIMGFGLQYIKATVQGIFMEGDVYVNNTLLTDIVASGANNSTISISAGDCLTTGGSFTLNQSSNKTITIDHGSLAASIDYGVKNSLAVINFISQDSFGHLKSAETIDLAAEFAKYIPKTSINTSATSTSSTTVAASSALRSVYLTANDALPKSGGSLTGNLSMGSNNVIFTSTYGLQSTGPWLKLSTAHGYIEFGPANATYAHIYTDRPNFYFNKELQVLGKEVYHAGNIPTWDQDTTGTAANANQLAGNQASYYNHRNYNDVTNYLGGYYVSGGSEKPNGSLFGSGRLKLAMLAGSNLGVVGTWHDVLWLSGYSGGDVKTSTALSFSKNTSGVPVVNILQQAFDAPAWGTPYEIYHTGNIPTWDQSTTGNAATATNLANIPTSFNGTYPMVVNASGTLYSDAGVTFRGSDNTLTCTNFAGNASTVTDGVYLNANNVLNGNNEFSSTDTSGNYGTAGIELREVGRVGNAQSVPAYAPALSFHWGQRVQGRLALHSDSRFHFTDGGTHTTYKDVQARTFYGALNGNATTASTASKVTFNAADTSNNNWKVLWGNSSDYVYQTAGFTFNPSKGELQVGGDIVCGTDVRVQGTGSNTAPATDDLMLSGYGLMGNRGNIYITNSSGDVSIGSGNVHGSSTKLIISNNSVNIYNSNLLIGGTEVIAANRAATFPSVQLGSIVLSESTDSSGLLRISDATTTWSGIQIGNNTEDLWSFMADGDTAGIYNDSTNEWHILFADNGATQLHHNAVSRLQTTSSGVNVTGIVTASGTITGSDAIATSDRRLKENLVKIEDPIGKLNAINGYTFNWISNPDERVAHTIAQEVEAVYPEAVKTNEEGTKHVSLSAEIALLIEVCKAQQKEIDELKRKVS